MFNWFIFLHRLHKDELIYRDERLINWSSHIQSSLSDVEIDKKELTEPTALYVPGYEDPVQFGIMHKFAYKLLNPVGKHIRYIDILLPTLLLKYH